MTPKIYDGVPSLHDAKAAWLIAHLYQDGLTKPWQELGDKERELNPYRREYELHESQHKRNQNRLEAFLSRHWPEVLPLLALDSMTLESLLIDYGSPEQIAAGAEQAAKDMRRWGKHCLSTEKIDAVIHSAATTLGQPCIEAERRYLQALAEELRHSRTQAKNAKLALEAVVKAEPELKEMGMTVGLIAINVLLDPDAATVERAQAANARLRDDYPDGFALDANHAPHIILLQRFVRTADLEDVANAVVEVLRTEESIKWESNATGYYDQAYKNLGLVGIVNELTEDLRRLQQRITDAVAPFAVEKETGEAFAPRPDGGAISQPTVD